MPGGFRVAAPRASGATARTSETTRPPHVLDGRAGSCSFGGTSQCGTLSGQTYAGAARTLAVPSRLRVPLSPAAAREPFRFVSTVSVARWWCLLSMWQSVAGVHSGSSGSMRSRIRGVRAGRPRSSGGRGRARGLAHAISHPALGPATVDVDLSMLGLLESCRASCAWRFGLRGDTSLLVASRCSAARSPDL